MRALEPLDVESTVGPVRVLAAHEHAAKLDWNESPFGPLPGVLDALGGELANVSRYPIEAYDDFRTDVARSLGVPSGCVVPGHGTQSLIGTVATTLLQPGDAVVQPAVTFYLYRMVSVARGAVVHEAPMGARGIDLEALVATAREVDAKLVWVCDPNNPTGTALERAEWEEFLDALPERCVVVADEAYVDFLPPDRRLGRERDVLDGKPLVVLRSFSKFFGLAGLRLGCAIADGALAGYLRVVDEPFNVNCMALAAGRASLRVGDEVQCDTAARGRRRTGVPHRGAGRRRCATVSVGGELRPRSSRSGRRAARAATPRRRHPRAGGLGARPARTHPGRPSLRLR